MLPKRVCVYVLTPTSPAPSQCHTATHRHATPPPPQVLNRSAAAYVLYLDLDAIFEPRVFLDDHPLDVFTRSGKSLILLGEMALCSCHFLLKRSPWSRWFLREWQARCAIPTYCTQGRGQDQVAYAILIYETIVNESDHQVWGGGCVCGGGGGCRGVL